MLGIVILVLALYLIVKAINLVMRVFTAHSSNKLLWGLLAAVIFFGLVSLGTRGEPIAIALTIVSALTLLVTCRILELYYAKSLQQQGTLVENVLRRKWWEPVTPDLAVAA